MSDQQTKELLTSILQALQRGDADFAEKLTQNGIATINAKRDVAPVFDARTLLQRRTVIFCSLLHSGKAVNHVPCLFPRDWGFRLQRIPHIARCCCAHCKGQPNLPDGLPSA